VKVSPDELAGPRRTGRGARARPEPHQEAPRLRTHALVFVLVNAGIVGIWAITDSGGFFWPVFPMVFWGIGLVMNAWDVYFSSDISEQEIDHEISRMHHR
jgi:hypothetical protein